MWDRAAGAGAAPESRAVPLQGSVLGRGAQSRLPCCICAHFVCTVSWSSLFHSNLCSVTTSGAAGCLVGQSGHADVMALGGHRSLARLLQRGLNPRAALCLPSFACDSCAVVTHRARTHLSICVGFTSLCRAVRFKQGVLLLCLEGAGSPLAFFLPPTSSLFLILSTSEWLRNSPWLYCKSIYEFCVGGCYSLNPRLRTF